MDLIEWKDEFCVGVPSVDHEHQEMIALINELHEGVSSDASSATVLEFLGEIYARISAHFALEEKVMREKAYDEYEDHKTDHEELLEEILDIMHRYEDGGFYDDAELANVLKTWFTGHFQTRDARLHRHLG